MNRKDIRCALFFVLYPSLLLKGKKIQVMDLLMGVKDMMM